MNLRQRAGLESMPAAIVALVWIASVAAPAKAGAQAVAAAPHVVRGTVFDSIGNMPLAGAVVQVASENTALAPLTDTTDAAGHFHFTGVPAGRYVIAFDHDVLRAFRLDLPLRELNIGDAAEQVVALAVPGGEAVRRARCGEDSTSGGSALIAGLIRNADSTDPVSGALVTATWQAIVLDRFNIRTERQHVTSRTGPDGTYALCGVPQNAPIDVSVSAAGFHTVMGSIETAPVEAVRRDLLLSDSSQTHGAFRLSGLALDDNGKRVQSGHVTIAALGVDAPITQGQFVVNDLPPGTWTVELRAIGYEPRQELVTLNGQPADARTFTLSKRPHTLDVVSVIGTPGRATSILTDILRRHRTTGGTIFLPGNPSLEAAMFPIDLLRATRGSAKSMGGDHAGACKLSEGIAPTRRTNLTTAVPKVLAVYLNGERFPLGFEALNKFILMRDVLAVESYSDVLSAPVEWRTNDACAVFVVWTKQ